MGKTPKEIRAHKTEYMRQWRAKNPEKARESSRKWRDNNPDYMKELRSTPIGRAKMLLYSYNKMDRDRGLPHGDLTAEWIEENIFTKPCAHCGITGWDIIGCNRLDNSKPHSIDNVEPCCPTCNNRLNAYDTHQKKKAKKQEEEDLELLTKPNI